MLNLTQEEKTYKWLQDYFTIEEQIDSGEIASLDELKIIARFAKVYNTQGYYMLEIRLNERLSSTGRPRGAILNQLIKGKV